MTLLQRQAQNLLHSRFSWMLISFLTFSLVSDQGKVKYSPLYGRGSKVTILVGRHFQSEMLPIKRSCKKKLSLDTFLLEIFQVNQKLHFFGGPTLPPSGPVL